MMLDCWPDRAVITLRQCPTERYSYRSDQRVLYAILLLSSLRIVNALSPASSPVPPLPLRR